MEGSPNFDTSTPPTEESEEKVVDENKLKFQRLKEILLGKRPDDSEERLAKAIEKEITASRPPSNGKQKKRVIDEPKRDWLSRWEEKNEK